MKKTTVYLAGKMTELTKEQMTAWREYAKVALEQIGAKAISPCDFYNFDMSILSYTEKEIMRFDIWAVQHSDIILLNLDYPDSIGTAIEVFEAYKKGIPIIAYRTDGNFSSVHPWILECVDKKFTGRNAIWDTVEYIKNYYIRALEAE